MGPVNVNYFADGVGSCQCGKTLKLGGLLDWGKKKYSGGSSSSTSNLQCFWNLRWKWLTLLELQNQLYFQ